MIGFGDASDQSVSGRYQRDVHFRTLVDMLEALISQAQYTPTELREALILALIRHEARTIRPHIIPLRGHDHDHDSEIGMSAAVLRDEAGRAIAPLALNAPLPPVPGQYCPPWGADLSGVPMNQINNGGQAFPNFASGHVEKSQGSTDRNLHFTLTGGMTLRDYFAGQALEGMLSQDYDCDLAAHSAYEFADAMLTAREAKS